MTITVHAFSLNPNTIQHQNCVLVDISWCVIMEHFIFISTKEVCMCKSFPFVCNNSLSESSVTDNSLDFCLDSSVMTFDKINPLIPLLCN